MSDPPRLLQFRVSHYNEKVRWALDYKRIPHVRETVVPGFHVPRVRKVSGQQKVPVLILDGKTVTGSSQILLEIERLCPEPRLYPEDPEARARALAIERFFDEEVAPDARRLFWWAYLGHPEACARMATDGTTDRTRRVYRAVFPLLRPVLRSNTGSGAKRVHAARARLPEYFDRLESEIGSSGYLVGDRFSVADLAAAALLTPIVRPPEFPYPLPEPWPDELVELRSSIEDRAGFRWVLEMYRRHRGTSSEVGL